MGGQLREPVCSNATMTKNPGVAPEEVITLAKLIGKIHGPVRWALEASGWQIYFPSPEALKNDGLAEVKSGHMHGCINASKYLNLGEHAQFAGTGRNERCAQCMKYQKKYSVRQLLEMKSLEERGIQNIIRSAHEKPTTPLIKDDKGNDVPQGPGRTLPLTLLPKGHPCLEFLETRNISVTCLNAWAPSAFCTEENPPNKEQGIYYMSYGGGFKATPQNRLIIYGMVNGVRQVWQGRLLQKTVDGTTYFFHPYESRWKAIGRNDPETGSLVLLPEMESKSQWENDLRKLLRYSTAPGASRNSALLGFDSALAFKKANGTKTIFVVEGPLKAVRVRPPCVAVMGVSLSEVQARMLAKEFQDIVIIPDNDGKKGQGLVDSALRNLAGYGRTPRILRLRPDIKDPDQMPQDEADSLFRKEIRS